jgi:hypothetical protein
MVVNFVPILKGQTQIEQNGLIWAKDSKQNR